MKTRTPAGIFRILFKQYGSQRWWPAKTPFEVIVGAILTQNTAWTNVEKAIRNLRGRRLLTPGRLSRVPDKSLALLLKPAGYFNVKTRRLKNFLLWLRQNYRGNLQILFRERTGSLRNKLLVVNGIGPETADSILLYAAQKPVFVVDAYTKRIFSRIGFFSENAGYSEIQHFFTKRLPLDTKLFNEFHALIVKLAKNCCRKKPLCVNCPLLKLCACSSATFSNKSSI